MTFALGKSSLAKLHGVHPVLVAVVKRAIEITEQDFAVIDGVRTIEQQKKLVAAGASKTMNSYHIPVVDRLSMGQSKFGHAVDLVPFINGQPRWEWPPIFKVAAAVDAAATEHGVSGFFTWGAVWDRRLSQYGGSVAAMVAEVEAYKKRHPGPDFLDGPHWQIAKG